MSKHLKKAVKALVAAFPDLEPVDLPFVIRLRNRETHDVLIDVMKPVQQPYCETFRNTHRIQIEGQPVRIPSLEMAIVMKFSAIASVHRKDEDKFQDAHDLIYMVKNNPERDKEKLSELASLIYPEAGTDLLEMLRKIESGEKLVF
jgi:predicted nucleotidyltransferase